MTSIRIATWNMSHAVKRGATTRASAWDYLRSLDADVALVQEAGLPIDSSVVGHQRAAESDDRNWATAVVSYRPALLDLPQPIYPSWGPSVAFNIPDAARPGTLALGVVETGDGQPIVAVSLYGMLRYADQSVLRAASDILPLFDSRWRGRVIIGGDFNIHTHSNDEHERARAVQILGLLESFGLRNLVLTAMARGVLSQGAQSTLQACPCGVLECGHIRTHRHRSHKAGEMANNDYLYATQDLASCLSAVTVMNGDADPAWTHSDHAPIVASFAL